MHKADRDLLSGSQAGQHLQAPHTALSLHVHPRDGHSSFSANFTTSSGASRKTSKIPPPALTGAKMDGRARRVVTNQRREGKNTSHAPVKASTGNTNTPTCGEAVVVMVMVVVVVVIGKI